MCGFMVRYTMGSDTMKADGFVILILSAAFSTTPTKTWKELHGALHNYLMLNVFSALE